MTHTGRLMPAPAKIGGWLMVAAFFSGCSGSEDIRAGADPVGEECVTDLATPTATYEVETADVMVLSQFLAADTAVVQVDSDRQPLVLGESGALQEALADSRVWAVAEDGLLVQQSSSNGEPRLNMIALDGQTLFEGPSFDEITRAQVVGDTFLVDAGGQRSAYDLHTGRGVEWSLDELAGTRSSIASSMVLTAEGVSGGVTDARTEEEFGLDELLGGGVRSISIAGSGSDRVLLRAQIGQTSQYWIWSAGKGVRKVYRSTDPKNLGTKRSPGVCGDLLYLVERGELKVIDTGDGDAVLSRRAFTVDDGANSGCDVLAIPGGVLVMEVDATHDSTSYTWFNG